MIVINKDKLDRDEYLILINIISNIIVCFALCNALYASLKHMKNILENDLNVYHNYDIK